MFHYLTVNVAEVNLKNRSANPRLALEAMHGYIKHFFGCADCSEHFQEMAIRRKIHEVASLEDAVLWLWQAHNEVNKRLSGDLTEDPKFPKIEFPNKHNCQRCRNPDESWDSGEVLKYLKRMYTSVNIHYMGADTSIIFLGLEGNRTGGSYNFYLYFCVYLATFAGIFALIKMFLKRGYRRKMYSYKHDLLGKV